MGLYLRGSVWWLSFMDPNTGKQVRRSTETEDEERAKRIFDKIKGQIAEGKWFERLPGQDISFGELIEKYLEEYSAVQKAPKTYLRDKSLKAHLLSHFAKLKLTQVTPRIIAEYKTKRRSENASPRTINYELALLSHAFTIAIREWEWVSENPVKKVTREKVHNQMERWLTPEEEGRLLGAAPEWLRDIILFAIHTGFRMSEILDLKWTQIDTSRRTVTISEQKNRGVDTLPLNATVMDILSNKAKGRAGGSGLVFPSRSGTRISNRNLSRAFKAALKKARIKGFRFHDLRHTFATRLVQNGVDLYAVQRLGRWKNTAMIMRYAHHNPESLRPGIETMDRAAKKNITFLSQSQKKRGNKPYLRLVTP